MGDKSETSHNRAALSRILSMDEVMRILRIADEKSQRDALALKLMALYGFTLGEVVGSPSRRMVDKKWVPMEPTFVGLKIEDLSDDGVLVRRKDGEPEKRDRKSTRLNSSHLVISYAVFC